MAAGREKEPLSQDKLEQVTTDALKRFGLPEGEPRRHLSIDEYRQILEEAKQTLRDEEKVMTWEEREKTSVNLAEILQFRVQ